MTDDPIPRLQPALRALHAWLESTKTPYLVIGGVAVSLIARARSTFDVDAVVLTDEDTLGSFIESGKAFGFVPRIEKPVEFAERSRMVLLVHEPSGIKADISLAGLPFEKESIARGGLFRAADLELRLPTVEDLIIMKAVASRLRDFADIETLVTKHPKLDRRRIRSWVRKFGVVLDAPEMVERLERLLPARPKHPARMKKRRPKR